MKILSYILATLFMVTGSASAHFFWINADESFSHMPGHVIFSLGFGHTMPVGDLLSGDFGDLNIKSYEIKGPDGKVAKLRIPEPSKAPAMDTDWDSSIYQGDFGAQKMAFSAKTKKGIYTVSSEIVPTFITIYKNEKGRQKFARKPINEVKGIKEVVASMYYSAFAKSYINYGGKWEEPKPLGKDLEIIPLTDMSNVKAGDLIKFKVIFNGKTLSSSFSGLEYMTAFSSTYGAHDGFQLFAPVKNGVAKFRIPEKGSWLASIYVERDVEKAKLKKFQGKTQQAVFGSTLSFQVRK